MRGGSMSCARRAHLVRALKFVHEIKPPAQEHKGQPIRVTCYEA